MSHRNSCRTETHVAPKLMSQPRSVVHNLKHSNSHFNTRNRASTFEIALQHSESHSNTRSRISTLEITPPTFEIALQRSKSRFNTRNRTPTLEIALQHSKSRFNVRNRMSRDHAIPSHVDILPSSYGGGDHTIPKTPPHSKSHRNTRNHAPNIRNRRISIISVISIRI